MAKLYPPHIEGALPAFCGNTLSIPFEHSRAVSQKEISCYHYILKDIQQSKIIGGDGVQKNAAIQETNGNWRLQCSGINTTALQPGTFYKLQLAYVDLSNTTGYFSDVGIIKYIQEPTVKLTGLSQTGINNHSYHYQLEYHCQDSTEKLYSTQFFIAETTQDNLILSSDVIIHNTNNDSQYDGTEGYDFLQELDPKKNYFIFAFITTTSGYQMTTPYYPLSAQIGIPDYLTDWVLTPELDFDNGCISLYITSETTSSAAGTFKLVRSDEKENFKIWHPLVEISLSQTGITQDNPYLLWRDFSVEQGYNYTYAMMQINDSGRYSTKKKADSIYADFEDAFLFDGNKQLRIRFDPKVSSFKVTVQESKTDTIGGKYPIIQRNGYTNYKEFPISGLISHLSDPNGYFNKGIAELKEIDNATVSTDTTDALDGFNYTTNLNGKNVQLERRFKLEVLNWLNNGEPKLFRSPTEGNYLVRLLGVSLSPVDNLGRMLHNFSCTAYEIDEATPEKLKQHDIIKDYYIEGRYNFNFDKTFASYYLSNLSKDINLLDKQNELKGKEIVGAAFAIAPNSSDVWVHVNDRDLEVSDKDNSVFNEKITSLKQPQSHNFNYSSSDLVTLTYRNVLNRNPYNDWLDKVDGWSGTNQYYGFNYKNMFGDIKIFLQRIYKMVCSIRPIIISTYKLTREFLQTFLNSLGIELPLEENTWISQLHKLGTAQLRKLIEYCCGGTCIASAAYKFLDASDNIVGYIDGQKCTWLKEADTIITGIAQATITFVNNIDGREVSNLVRIADGVVKTFTGEDLGTTLTNIIANPFTCVDMIYKAGVNVFNRVSGLSKIYSSQTTNKENTMANFVNTTTSIAGSVLNQCENAYNNIVNGLKNNGTIPTASVNGVNDTSQSDNITTVITKAAETATDLAQTAVNILTSGTGSTSTLGVSLTNVASSVVTTLSSVFNGLFGGMC